MVIYVICVQPDQSLTLLVLSFVTDFTVLVRTAVMDEENSRLKSLFHFQNYRLGQLDIW